MIDMVAVHTTGVNWEGALFTASSVVVLLTPVGVVLLKSFQRSIKDTIRDEVGDIIAVQVTPRFVKIESAQARQDGVSNAHATAIARLEGVQEGKRQMTREAGLTTKSTD